MGVTALTAAHLIALVRHRVHYLGRDRQALLEAVETGRLEALVEDDP